MICLLPSPQSSPHSVLHQDMHEVHGDFECDVSPCALGGDPFCLYGAIETSYKAMATYVFAQENKGLALQYLVLLHHRFPIRIYF